MKVKDREKQTMPVPHHTVVHQLLAALETACRNVEDKKAVVEADKLLQVAFDCYAERHRMLYPQLKRMQRIAPDSSTRADLLELFGFDKSLVKTARCI